MQLAPFEDGVDTIGTLEAIEEVSLATRVAGRIDRLLVREGQVVKQGQLLLQLDQTQARANLASAREKRDNDCIDFRRFDFLAAKGAASVLQRDSFRARCLQANEDVKAREADLAFSNLKAPITGVVSDLAVKQGDVVQAGSPFTKLIRNDQLRVRVELPAVYASRVRVGQQVFVEAPGGGGTLARGRVNFIDPNVTADTQGLLVTMPFQNPGPDLRRGMRLRTRVLFETRQKPAVPFSAVTQSSGQSFVFRVGSLQELKANPSQLSPEQLAALPANGTYALQTPVTLGPVQDDRYPLEQGVNLGDRVITTNLIKLRHGTPVVVQ